MPGSEGECPAPPTITSSPYGQARGEFPRGHERAAEVEATLHHDPGDAGQGAGFAQQDAVFEPGVVAEVMRHDACPGHPEVGLRPHQAGFGVGVDRHERRLPVVPVTGGLRAHGGVGVVQETVIGLDEVAIALGGGDADAEPFPLLGKQRGYPLVEPVDL